MAQERPDSPTAPVAIIGLACRLPQAPSPAAYWRLLCAARNAVTEVPPERRIGDDTPGPSHAGLLDRVDGFDAGFFGIGAREAAAMDPQQRLMLELAWECLEDAGVRPDTLAGGRTAVFASAMWDDYAALTHRQGPAGITRHTMTGLQRGIIANRVSHRLGLHGPSLTVDSGQSSGLLAVHLACDSLRQGDAELAIVGAVNLILAPDSTRAARTRFEGLSPDGRCHTFDARANGFVRGEGGAAVLLKPLASAVADGDPVYAVIRGSAVNNDGDTDGLLRPSAAAQHDVLRRALERAGVPAADVQYVELHGTGTPVGDPIEATALGAALGQDRPADAPLLIGSAKTNIGHLEAAAGLVGMLKTALSIRHRQLPASLNFDTPNPAIALDDLGLRVQTELSAWPRPDRPLTAGVSSFGMGGTNCHVVLAEAPDAAPETSQASQIPPASQTPDGERPARPTRPAPAIVPWFLSATSPTALTAQARALRDHLRAQPSLNPVDVGHALSTTRAAFAHRAVVLGANGEQLLSRLDTLADGGDAAGLFRGRATGGQVAFLFSGQGSQRPGMGRELAESHPVFADALREVCAHLDRNLDVPLLDVLAADAASEPGAVPLLNQTSYTQPALFAIEVALYRLAESWGLRPDHLIGHSVGEIAAAHVAGVLSLADASTLVTARGRLMQSVSTPGAMAAWQASAQEATEVIEALGNQPGRLDLAAENGPASVVVSGDRDAVLAATTAWRARGRKATMLNVSHAFHSWHMDEILDDLRAIAAGLAFGAPRIPLVSNVTGRPVTEDQLRSPGYWADHARQAVRFHDGVRHLCAAGVDTFVELGPDASLASMARECFAALPADEPRPVAVAVQRRDRSETDTFLAAMAQACVRGAAVDFGRAFAGVAVRRVSLPTYAFQRERHWLDSVHDDLQDHETFAAPTPAEPAESQRVAPESESAPASATTTPAHQGNGTAELLTIVRTSAAIVLGHGSPDRVDPSLTFKELGFDSLAATELSERLTATTGITVPATVAFEHPTPVAVVAYLREAQSQASDTDARPGSAGTEPITAAANAADPIAIVAVSCRYPGGADSPEALWALVEGHVDAVGDFPRDRGWDLAALSGADPDRAGASHTGQGGFLYDAALFDADFFGISPREALATDPQQRILLELSWELLERAGIAPAALAGSATGVFVGATSMDYGPRLHEAAAEFEGYRLTGGTPSVASGRVAYALGLEGPAVTIDTACSSSLVAMHLAAQSLRTGECDLALAGGVTVMATPGMFSGFSRQRGLAPDGRCKPFAAAADGTGWGEGAGLVLLERLSDARRNGHEVLAVIRGSAINQDGASNGLTAPSGPAQQRVIGQALAAAGLAPGEVDVVEAHGTGTTLGDPIEARALLATYGRDRPEDRPLLLGSVKSNIGHTQAAAGAAGVIKMMMAMRHGVVPASLHVDEPTPHVDWSTGTVRVATEAVDWPWADRPRRAAVSSFGISGTNAHLILEQAPETDSVADAGVGAGAGADAGAADARTAPLLPWVLSARSADALREQASQLADRFQAADPPSLADVAWSLITTRSPGDHRAVVGGFSRDEMLAGLRAIAEDDTRSTTTAIAGMSGTVPGAAATGAVMVFPGQGSQWIGMGVELLDTSPVFAARIAECEAALSGFVDWSLTEVLRGAPGAPDPGRVDVVQPVLWAMMVSLAALWRSYGIVPGAVVGHSQGEIAAAVVAGALSLEDGARIVALRSRALRALEGHGAMASLGLSPDETTELLDALETDAASETDTTLKTDTASEAGPGQVAIAALNGPFSTVVSGTPARVAAAVAACEATGRRARMIDVSYASHGPQVDRLADVISADLAGIRPVDTETAYYSSLTGARHATGGLDAEYWFTSLRRPVRFASAISALLDAGHRVFVEVSPHPVLIPAIREGFDEADVTAAAVPTLRRADGGPAQLVRALGEGFAAGLAVDWTRWFPAGPRPRTVALPTYPFQRQRYWLADGSGGRERDTAGAGVQPLSHTMLTSSVELADGGLLLNGLIPGGEEPGWTDEHTVAGVGLIPGAVLVEWALRAADEAGAGTVQELLLRTPFPVPGPAGTAVQVAIAASDPDGRRDLRIFSRPCDVPQEWTCHAVGLLAPERTDSPERTPAGSWPPPDAEPIDPYERYELAEKRGYGYGPALRGVRSLWRDGSDLLAEAELPEAGEDDADAFGIHPLLLDTVVQAALLADEAAGPLWLPFEWDGVTLWAGGARRIRIRLTTLPTLTTPDQEPDTTTQESDKNQESDGAREPGDPDEWRLRVTVTDLSGAPVLSAETVTLRARTVEQLRQELPATPRPQDGEQTPRTRQTRRPPTRPAADAAPADWAGRLSGLAPAERHRLVLDLVRRHAAAVLGRATPEEIRTDLPFKDLGFDSMTAVELRDRLAQASGLRLPAAVVFRHPTPEGLARRLGQELAPNGAAAEGGAGEPDGATARTSVRTPVRTPAGSPVGAVTEPGFPDVSNKLKTATAEEILAYIDDELGVPSGVRPRR